VIAVRNVQETNLAWALIDAAKPHLNARERNYVFVTVGAGDTFAAIRSLINLVAAKCIPLRPHLVQLCTRWLDSYVLHEEYGHLRRLIEGFLMPDTIQASTAISRLTTSSKREGVLTATGRWGALGACLRERVRLGEHDTMARLVPDQILDTFCVVAPTWPEAVMAARARYAGGANPVTLRSAPPLTAAAGDQGPPADAVTTRLVR